MRTAAPICLLAWAISLAHPSPVWCAADHQDSHEEPLHAMPLILQSSVRGSASGDRHLSPSQSSRYGTHDPSRSQHHDPADALGVFLKNGVERRWSRELIQVDYMEMHPFEKSAQQKQNDAQNQNARHTQSMAATAYQPMRVYFDTHLLDALANAYPTHVSYIRNVLLPSLQSFWADALTIIPAKNIEVPLSGPLSRCAQDVKQLSGLNLDDILNNSSTADNIVEMVSGGNSLVYNDIDLVVIVIPVEGTFLCPESQGPDNATSTLAFATNCQHDQFDRPTVGYTGICFGPLDPSDRTAKMHKRRLLTMAHEMMHILGFNSKDIPFFYDHATGKPRTPRDEDNWPPFRQTLCVDGTNQNVITASEDTLKQVTTATGHIAYELVTETVRNVVRNQFDCQTMIGGRLENQPTSTLLDCFGSHWDHRLFNNEFMSAVNTGSTQYITALTLAFLEDTGWYHSNFSVAENSPYGLGAGCEFVDEQCIQNGEVPEWGKSTFCNDSLSIGCTTDKHLVAVCDMVNWLDALPSGYQYFDNPNFGGVLQQRDFCPAYTTIFRFENGDATGMTSIPALDCTNPDLQGIWIQEKGEVFGEASRCIEHASGIRPICLEVDCVEEGEDAGKVVLIVEGERMVCSNTGEVWQLPSGKEVICPSFQQTCPESLCPANCAGRGFCDYSIPRARCECFDRLDASPFCANLPLSFVLSTSTSPTQSSSSPVAASTGSPTRLDSTSAAPNMEMSTRPSLLPSASQIIPSTLPTNSPTATRPTLQSGAPITSSPIASPVNDTAIPTHLPSESPISNIPTLATGSPTNSPSLLPMTVDAVPDPETTHSSCAFQPGVATSFFLWAVWTCWVFA